MVASLGVAADLGGVAKSRSRGNVGRAEYKEEE